MACVGGIMTLLFQLIICFILLLFTETAAPKMQPMIYTATYFFIFLIVFNAILIPFMQQFTLIFKPFMNPYFKLTIESALYFLIASTVSDQFEQAGYTSLGKLTNLTVKIIILSLWLSELHHIIQALAQLNL